MTSAGEGPSPETPMTDPRSRHFRVVFKYPKAGTPADITMSQASDYDLEGATPFFIPDGAMRFDVNDSVTRLAGVGRCIYCGTEDGPLHEEHVIPEALGARLTLPSASCDACQTKILAYEGNILGSLLRPARRHMRIRSKRRKRPQNQTHPLYVFDEDTSGTGINILVPVGEHPSILMLPYLHPPRMFTCEPVESYNIIGVWGRMINEHLSTVAKGIKVFSPCVLDTVYFCQFLAKTAHALAVAKFGLDGFVPSLKGFILADYRHTLWEDRYWFIGGEATSFAPSPHLHVAIPIVVPNEGRIHGKKWLLMRLRLFASSAAPVYDVVVGSLTDEQAGRFRVKGAIPLYTSDKNPDPFP
jgi:hypothetical protein